MTRKRHVAVLQLLILCCVAVLTSCGPRSNQANNGGGIRAALITPGSIADAAWNAGAYAGLLQVRDSLGLPVSHIEARTPAEQEEALRAYAAQGYGVIYGHGFEFQDAAERVATDYPDAVFVITSGQRVSGNVVPLVFRFGEATYLAGMVAGSLTRSGRVGFIGGIELPPVRLGQDAWERGARSANPRVQTRSTYLNNFDDAVAGREAALAMIRLGVDMLHHNADQAGLGVFQAARESPGVYVFGANADQSALAPDRVLGSAVIDVPRAILMVAREVQAGRFTPRVESFGLEGGVVRYVGNPALDSVLTPALRAWLDAARDSIIAGTLRVSELDSGQELPASSPRPPAPSPG